MEELARKMGVDPAVLRATVDEYNGFCEKGHDDLFAKNPKYSAAPEGDRDSMRSRPAPSFSGPSAGSR